MNQGGHPGGSIHGPPHHGATIQGQTAHAQALAAQPHAQVSFWVSLVFIIVIYWTNVVSCVLQVNITFQVFQNAIINSCTSVQIYTFDQRLHFGNSE